MANGVKGEEKSVVLTGLQPTAGIQLGNYLGTLRNWVRIQDDYSCFFFIVDFHAITVPQNPEDLGRNILNCVALYLAVGLDPDRAQIFVQSQIHGHTELMWILGCLTSIGQLERMTQFKDKAKRRGGDGIGAGLLYYPVLMAADILLYNADFVPIGEDQKQHLELARDLAERFNGTYGELFRLPRPLIGERGARIMSLQDPRVKMSKSDPNGLATIFLTDSNDAIARKIRSAVTDSDGQILARPEKPGISNLLEILATLSDRSIGDLENDYRGHNYGKLKRDITDRLIAALEPIRNRYGELCRDREYLRAVARRGRVAAQARADRLLGEVYGRVGLYREAQ